METIFKDFKKYGNIPDDIMLKYKDKVPTELLEVWGKYGLGSLINSYLKLINPDDYLELLEGCYLRSSEAVPIFTTSMGDIIVWEKERYVNLLSFRKGYVSVISSGFEFFFDDLNDINFINDELNWQPYTEAIKKNGEPTYGECFGYIPILGIGGVEKVENLKKVKLREHIYLITQFMGPIG